MTLQRTTGAFFTAAKACTKHAKHIGTAISMLFGLAACASTGGKTEFSAPYTTYPTYDATPTRISSAPTTVQGLIALGVAKQKAKEAKQAAVLNQIVTGEPPAQPQQQAAAKRPWCYEGLIMYHYDCDPTIPNKPLVTINGQYHGRPLIDAAPVAPAPQP